MTFQPGNYYVGDLGFVLPNDDLRILFTQVMNKELKSGLRRFITPRQYENEASNIYWLVSMPSRNGTVYDQDNNGWGFDWGCFGILPWDWSESQGSYASHKINFTEPFTCSFTDDSITIGHLHFTFNPK